MKRTKLLVLIIMMLTTVCGAIAKKLNRTATMVYYYTSGGICTSAFIESGICFPTANGLACASDFGEGLVYIYNRKISQRVCATVLRHPD